MAGGIEAVYAARRGMLCLSTPMGESEVDRALAGIRRAVLAGHAEHPLPARAAGELVAEAR